MITRRTALLSVAAIPLVTLAGDAVAAPPPPKPLFIYKTECDFVIAESPEHAAVLYRKFLGYKETDVLPEPDAGEEGLYAEHWEKWCDNKPFPLCEEWCEVEGAVEPGAPIFNRMDKDVWQKKRDCKAPVFYESDEGDDGEQEIVYRYTSKLPAEWVKDHGPGFFASTEF